ncbi:MAG: molybdate ABC transporter permease subunit [Clostridium sp.]|nr:molybdate ABC transporter permease subunit [Clostridium sp.]
MLLELSPLFISLQTAAAATAAAFFPGILAARWLAHTPPGKGKALADGLLIMPLLLPPTVIGFLLLLIFGNRGLLGRTLSEWGLPIVFTWPGAVIAAAVVTFPLMYRTARGAFEQVDPDMLDAARTMGDTEWRLFWRILLPLSWPGITSGIILSFARALGEFGATLMLAGNIPGKTQTMPIAIYFAVEGGKRDVALVWTLIMIAVATTIVLSLNYWSDRRQNFAGRHKGK